MALWKNVDTSGTFPKSLPVGRLLTIAVTDGGTGYTNGASVAVTIGAPSGGGVQAVATANVVGGIVQSITLSNQGSKYATLPSITMATGTGLVVAAVKEAIVYDPAKIIYVDITEAGVASNKSRGVTSPGWWFVDSYVDSDGQTRYKSEHLVAISETAGTAGDLEDVLAADVDTVCVISVQPTAQNTAAGAATFSVTANITPSGTALYQWQVQLASATKWTNVGGATAASLVLAGQTAGDTGKKYRVKVSAAGAKALTSNEVALTFVS